MSRRLPSNYLIITTIKMKYFDERQRNPHGCFLLFSIVIIPMKSPLSRKFFDEVKKYQRSWNPTVRRKSRNEEPNGTLLYQQVSLHWWKTCQNVSGHKRQQNICKMRQSGWWSSFYGARFFQNSMLVRLSFNFFCAALTMNIEKGLVDYST
jgi:hypothetical protein